MIELAAAKNKLDRIRTELLTTGSVGVYDVRFRFDGAWDGLDRIAVFRAGTETGELAQDPTPDALQQALSQALAERNAAEAAAERAESAAETALAAAASVAEDEEVEEMLGEIYPAREETAGG